MSIRFALPLIAACVTLASCSEAVVEPPARDPLPTTTVRDFPADTGKTGHYTFFRMRDSSIVALGDSATGGWDIGFNSTAIITNSGASGGGKGGWILLQGTDYDALTTAPETGYSVGPVAKEWYTYTGSTGTPPHTILMKPGAVIVLKTADGKYAKMQILSYYKGGPSAPTGAEPSRYYTFKYFYQSDGSRTLSN